MTTCVTEHGHIEELHTVTEKRLSGRAAPSVLERVTTFSAAKVTGG
jgi:hypothetical protein